MSGSLSSNLLAIPQGLLTIAKGLYAGEIVNNRLNPIYLEVATTGYRIQSNTLHIPDRIGFFSSGPPRLQVHQAFWFMFVILASCFSFVSGSPIIYFVRLSGLPTFKLVVALLAFIIAEAVFVWVLVCCDRRRLPGHNWEDWKLRND